MSLAVDVALSASLEASRLRGLGRAQRGRGRRGGGSGLGNSHGGEEAGEEDGETHGDWSVCFCWECLTKRWADSEKVFGV